MELRFLPQVTRIIEINLDGEKVLKILEKRFEEINSSGAWQDDFLDELFFQRGEGQFRIDTSVSAGKGGVLALVALGSTKETQDKTRLILNYAVYSYGVELFFRIMIALVCLLVILVIAYWLASGFELQSLILLLPLVIAGAIVFGIRMSYESGIIDLHNEIYWALSQIHSI